MKSTTPAEFKDDELDAVIGGSKAAARKTLRPEEKAGTQQRRISDHNTMAETDGLPVDYELADDFAP